MSEEDTIWLIEFSNGSKQYVLAPDEKKAHVVLKRMYRAPRYDFDWEDYEITDTNSTDIESMARGSEPPFSVLEANQYTIQEHEKRVNQAGYKGMYVRVWNR